MATEQVITEQVAMAQVTICQATAEQVTMEQMAAGQVTTGQPPMERRDPYRASEESTTGDVFRQEAFAGRCSLCIRDVNDIG